MKYSLLHIVKSLLAACLCIHILGCGSGPANSSSVSSVELASASTASITAMNTAAVSGNGQFLLTSDAGTDGGMLPVEYTCDGSGSSPALSWSHAPEGTKEFALMMTTLPGDGTTKWNWVVYGIQASATGLSKNNTTVGITGTGSHGTSMIYDGPCSQGPGAKLYTFTIYALSASPSLPSTADLVTGSTLTGAISSITLGSATLNLNYARP